ncbi:MAG: anhydro-N-acetylmuramic acid kinase [Arenimonas sp.]
MAELPASPQPADSDDGGLFIGLMSGTSVDGIDAALVRFAPTLQLLFARTYPLPEALATQVLEISQARVAISLDNIGELDTRLGQALANAANALLRDSDTDRTSVRAIGSHGQTLRHKPSGSTPFTLQSGDGNVIAEATGIATVADFRRRDVAAGGQGAPLVPAFHAAMLQDEKEDRAVLNIGGIANLTLLPRDREVRGFDTGPGNGLMDAWCLHHRNERFDRDGAFAGSGQASPALLERLLQDPWLSLPPPKSTGRDQFHLPWLEEKLVGLSMSPEDVQASLCRFTAQSIAGAVQSQMPECTRVLVCGGGVHNLQLMLELAQALPEMRIESTAQHDLDPDFVEAMAFAWLARETLAGRPGNLPAVTGARGLRVLGTVYPGDRDPVA